MTSATQARPAAWVCALALSTLLTACTADDPGEPTPSGSSGSSSSSSAESPKTLGSLADSVLSAPTPEPVAEQSGTVRDRKAAAAPGDVSVVTLNRGSGSTVLLLRLSTRETMSPALGILSADEVGSLANGIHVTVGEQDYYPGTFTYSTAVLAKNCVCTEQVRELGPEGVWVSAQFEQVPEGTSSATLTVPGFEGFEVPVTSDTPAS